MHRSSPIKFCPCHPLRASSRFKLYLSLSELKIKKPLDILNSDWRHASAAAVAVCGSQHGVEFGLHWLAAWSVMYFGVYRPLSDDDANQLDELQHNGKTRKRVTLTNVLEIRRKHLRRKEKEAYIYIGKDYKTCKNINRVQ